LAKKLFEISHILIFPPDRFATFSEMKHPVKMGTELLVFAKQEGSPGQLSRTQRLGNKSVFLALKVLFLVMDFLISSVSFHVA
jgi:hypothetical protein